INSMSARIVNSLFLSLAIPALAQSPQLTLEIKDLIAMPITGGVDATQNASLLARLNSLREEPGGRGRFFVADMNGPLYIVDRKTLKVATYLDFNGREGKSGLFHRSVTEGGLSHGYVGIQFDPE